MAYVLMNKIVFYKVLERYYRLEKLEPLYERGKATTCSAYLRELTRLFERAVEVSKDFEAIFRTGIYDAVEVVESEEVVKNFDWLVNLLDRYQIEKFGDVVGFMYEELIPAEERHQLGQFYTPKPIAELITKWCIRSPDDKVLDPGCGSGTFLVEAYKRLAELKLKKPYTQIKHIPEDVHRQILRQLYGVDINEFPAHLTAMNLAMKNVRTPSPEIYVFVRDYFTIKPGQHVLAPYKVKTPEGERQIEVVFKDFDAVVGNPPYTRWDDISNTVRRNIISSVGDLLKKYDLLPQTGRRGAEYTMVVFWVAHSIGFLKEGGRLGMIVSDSWLQTAYGVRFGRLLADHFKIHAIIDISARVFPAPLIGSCIILLEKNSNEHEHYDNDVVFAYLNVKKGGVNVQQLLKLVEEKRPLSLSTNDYDIVIKIHKQGEVRESDKLWIRYLFDVDYVLTQLKESKLITQLGNYFEPTYGNILYTVLYTRRIVKAKHAGVGGDKFFYLSEKDVEKYGIPREFLYSLVANAKNLPYFTFTKEDWENLRKGEARCHLFLCHKPRNALPPQVLRYIHLGETEIKPSKGIHKEEPVSRTEASENRRKLRQFFFDWYDLGGVISVPLASPRYTRYWHRFNLVAYDVAFSDDFVVFIPRQDAVFNENEMKALLAYLNSSIAKLYLETYGRTAGGVAALGLEVKPLINFPVLDVKRLPTEDVERLARLFDRLESEARRLGGADEVENVFGSELAKELTGKSDIRVSIQGLFNTVIKEIDYEIARILGLEHLVEILRTLVLELVRRRLSRAGEARREAVRGSEELRELRRPRRRRGSEGSGGTTRRLDEYFRGGQGSQTS
jgi:type I restriction-modification system DNA methylase subunit